jgi:hypothetical protein
MRIPLAKAKAPMVSEAFRGRDGFGASSDVATRAECGATITLWNTIAKFRLHTG